MYYNINNSKLLYFILVYRKRKTTSKHKILHVYTSFHIIQFHIYKKNLTMSKDYFKILLTLLLHYTDITFTLPLHYADIIF